MAKKNKKYEDSHFEEYLDTQTIVDVDIEQRMKEAFIDYAMSVIVARALPDVRDGLKPVHRRILYAMYEEHLTADKPFFKSATTVGNVIGRYHPHGDASAYDALVRMAQDFSLRYTLIDGHGNFGSVDGDPPAAYRYTEARMSKIANLLLQDIEKNTVDFSPNFDEKRVEPTVLPTRIPTLLINGSSGIAVGMATNIPPHNLTEVINGVIAQIDNPFISVEELMEHIKGPDFPTKAMIMGRSGIRAAYNTGKGRVIVRARTEIVENRDGSSSIIVTELPYQVNKKLLVESIADLVKEKKIEGLRDIDDHSSDRVGIRLEISLQKNVNAQVVLNKLYKFTRLQDSFSINMLAIVDGKPQILGLKAILDNFINFQVEVVTRRIKYDLEKALARMHILEGFKIALANIDEVIAVIRSAYDDAKEKLMERFGFSEIQAQSVLDMRLAQLQRLNGEKIDNEYDELTAKTAEYREILADEQKMLNLIKEELTEIKEKYGDERLTSIEPGIIDIEDEDLIEVEDVVITKTHFGYVKRLSTDTYRTQRRGGVGVSGLSTREEDFVEEIFVTSTHNYILWFTNKGRMFKLKGYQIPEGSRTSKGTAIVNLLNLDKDEKISTVIPLKDFEDGKYLTMITRNGVVKKTDLESYDSNRSGGIIAIRLDDDDQLIRVLLTDGNNDIILGTHNGMAIRFNEEDARPLGRVSRGVRGIRLKEDDYVVGACLVNDTEEMLVISENGMGKRTGFDEYKVQSRGGMGVRTYKISEKTGKVAAIKAINNDMDLMMITSEGVIIRTAADGISTLGRSTSGVRIMKLKDGVKVVSVATAEKEPEEEVTESAEETTTEVTE